MKLPVYLSTSANENPCVLIIITQFEFHASIHRQFVHSISSAPVCYPPRHPRNKTPCHVTGQAKRSATCSFLLHARPYGRSVIRFAGEISMWFFSRVEQAIWSSGVKGAVNYIPSREETGLDGYTFAQGAERSW